MKNFFFMIAVLCLAIDADATATAQQSGQTETRPNIILIMSDDMGYSDLGCYGGEIATPNLDSLADGGVRFTQFYNTARCCPTRASLLTGLHPHQAGMGHMTGTNRQLTGYRGDLNQNCATIAEALKSSTNYRAYCVGKWHVANQTKANGSKHNWPLQRGFDRYYGIISGAANYFDPQTLVRDNAAISPFNDPEYQPKEQYYLTRAISDNAVKFVKEHKEKTPNQPFFMYVAFTAAHWPMQAPEESVAQYRGKYDAGYAAIRKARYAKQKELGLISDQWELSPQAEDWNDVADKAWEARCMEVYAAMITELDKGIGEITASLKETGQYENTTILFLQDNGACAENIGREEKNVLINRPEQPQFEPIARDVVNPPLGNRTRDGYPIRRGVGATPGPADTFIAYGRGWANVSNTPFREYKHWVHEGGISTPLIVHSPKYVDKSMRGKFYREPGQLVDLMATCLDLAGGTYPKKYNGNKITPLEGITLVPGFSGKSLTRAKPLVWEHEGNRAIRVGSRKLVAKGEQGAWELYDLESDRSERNNLAEQYPREVETLSKQWNEWAVRANVLPCPWGNKNTDDDGIVPDKTPGLKLQFDFSDGKRKIAETSGKKNKFTVQGKINVSSQDGKAGRSFDGESYIDVEKSPAIHSAQTAWKAKAVFQSERPDGVILAYGGTRHGYSLFLKDGKPNFAVRINGQLFIATGQDTIVGRFVQLTGSITPEKKAELLVNGERLASVQLPDFIVQNPIERLQIGADLEGQTSGEDLPNFNGWIERIELYREQ
ncbi:MAG: sulfatase-like hydrolase/transferase [Planctomycetaceae bacterium]|jgi:arylsulfatase|nr:sulfatase-like hydrolase/transferase [Planctomycetaceae bacterium]